MTLKIFLSITLKLIGIERTPSDEILLTELALDDKDFEIFDITSIIKVGERQDVNPFGKFKCY
jgi:hypothetical protein